MLILWVKILLCLKLFYFQDTGYRVVKYKKKDFHPYHKQSFSDCDEIYQMLLEIKIINFSSLVEFFQKSVAMN